MLDALVLTLGIAIVVSAAAILIRDARRHLSEEVEDEDDRKGTR